MTEFMSLPQLLGFQSWFTLGVPLATLIVILGLVFRALDQISKGEMKLMIEIGTPALGASLRGRILIQPKKPLDIEALNLEFRGVEVHRSKGRNSNSNNILVHTESVILRQHFKLNPPQRFDLPFELQFPRCYKPTPSLADLNVDAIFGNGGLGQLMKSAVKSLTSQTLRTRWTLQLEAVMSGANFIESESWMILVDPENLRRDWSARLTSGESTAPSSGIKIEA
jgi:hypothetical protein